MLYLLLNSAILLPSTNSIFTLKLWQLNRLHSARLAVKGNAMETLNLLRNTFTVCFSSLLENARLIRALFNFYFSSILTWYEDSWLSNIAMIRLWTILGESIADILLLIVFHQTLGSSILVWYLASIPISPTMIKMTKVLFSSFQLTANRERLPSCARRWRNVLKTIISLIKIISSSSKSHQLSTSVKLFFLVIIILQNDQAFRKGMATWW